ncbi:MAG: GAF domain-containing protein [Pseudomonadota bacterium]
MPPFDKHAINFLRRSSEWQRTIRILFVLGGALVAGGAQAAALGTVDPDFVVRLRDVTYLGIAMVFVGELLLLFINREVPDLIELGLASENKAREFGDMFNLATAYSEWAKLRVEMQKFVVEAVEDAVSRGTDDHATQVRRFDSILNQLSFFSHGLFAMKDERWNFAIYVYDHAEGLLKCQSCRRFNREDEDRDHRSWAPGEGHVGQAFQRRQELICKDTTDPNYIQHFEAPPDKSGPYDPDLYKSIVSIPIRLYGGDPLGILVATSDKAGRFIRSEEVDEYDWDRIEPLRDTAALPAILIGLADIREHGAGGNHA